MALRRLSGECKGGDWTCPGVWEEDGRLEDIVIVGELIDPASAPPLGQGEVAIRLRRQVIRDAQII